MLEGKHIVVTGANRGIGLAIVEECAKEKANIVACVRVASDEFKEHMNRLQQCYGIAVEIVTLDLNDENSIKDAVSQILSKKIKIDGIVNNAGITGGNNLFSMTSMEDIKNVFQVNYFGPMLFLQRFSRKLMRWGNVSIVNMASVAAIDGEPAQLEYVSSKAALIGATKKLASEWGQFHIRVNVVAPGITETDMASSMDEELKNTTLNRTVMKRLAQPKEVAQVVSFLLSEKSGFITGQVIRVDGGGL